MMGKKLQEYSVRSHAATRLTFFAEMGGVALHCFCLLVS